MTPLAHRIVKELTLPKRRRTFDDKANLLAHMDDIHCFDVSDIFEMASDLSRDMIEGNRVPTETLGFLPAQRTWIEWSYPDGNRWGVLLEGRTDDDVVRCTWAATKGRAFASNPVVGRLLLSPKSWSGEFPAPYEDGSATVETMKGWLGWLYAVLAIINTPRVIGRRQHMPHRGLERRLTRALGVQGRFPLNAWTEIKLQVASTRDASGDASTEAHLTGLRALHFCRAHLRIRLGRLEFVSSHWRGDASIGIKQSRYKLTA